MKSIDKTICQGTQINHSTDSRFVISIDRSDFSTWLQIVILLMPHFNPAYFNTLRIFGSIVDGMRMASMVVILVLYLHHRHVLSTVTILIILQRLYLLSITLIYGGQVKDKLIEMGSILAVLLLFELYLSNSKWGIFLSAVLFCFEVMLYINIVTIILFPHGMYMTNDISDTFFVSWQCWFLGYYNNLTQYAIPAFMFALLYMNETGRKVRSIIMILSIYLSVILLKSGGLATSIIVMSLIWMLFKNKTVLFNYYMYWISGIVFIIGALTIGLNTGLVSWFLSSVLGKSNSYLGRVILWGKYIGQIRNSLFFGHGASDLEIRKQISGMNWGTHAHNLLLEILYSGGIIHLLLWILIILVAGRYIYKYKDDVDCKIIATCFAGWCVDSFVEPFMSPFLMAMFVIAYYVGKNEEYFLQVDTDDG